MCKLLLDSAAAAINCDCLSLWSVTEVFFTSQGTADSCYVLNYERPPHQIENIILT